MGDLLRDLVFDYTLRNVAMGSAALGTVSGTLGAFAVLRRQSLLGDAISHAALPGIALAFLLTQSKEPIVLILGAALAGWLGTLLVMAVVNATRIPEDSALGIVLSVFFGVGLVLLTLVQRMPLASQAGLETFLFGQAATLVARDVAVIGGLGAVALLAVVLFWKEFKLLSFDRGYGMSLGFPMRGLDVLLTSVLVLAIVVGLQTVGVVLMSAMVVAPAAAARQWTDSLGVMVTLSALFGALAGVTGALVSSTATGLPTGPTIVLSVSVLVAISLFLGARRGLLWGWLGQRRSRREIRTEAVLQDLYALASHHGGLDHGHAEEALDAMGTVPGAARRTLESLETDGLARKLPDGTWSLTPAGQERARRSVERRTEGGAP